LTIALTKTGMGTGWKIGREERAPFKLGMGPRGLNPALYRAQLAKKRCYRRIWLFSGIVPIMHGYDKSNDSQETIIEDLYSV